ncbi:MULTISPECIES: flagellar basal body rod protein FlgC [Chromohalobacter]|uniref:Flagellar basal-body rod protein FlgC n=1 Tax=Chromohalobacter israelensis (strain ATCC BAA-138 / DSM 3043 / CIP 106854 / NCIMB 13768 / 1H11) TaxID=290398 RepID=Q1QW29_CHRI1|nr:MULTISPECIES: flagellar basal body rod protein FlgC [Chromohalobacter]ABE59329.1 flagellar basal-body rod protein FlgC [Chromohalobacter salexigens DSM 3043]MBZ5876998.1 flagellar basal body rod protein FlgC [Chromohalobacter salexigens]MDF9434324.1 flagellar basal body rod protein FlgC [Chromohalobacter israelensis]MDO0946527.1 flagellar basal body rod protein FlgC [Chromohalobacter salexigens]NQY46702.1 flagellar basal body rod protein FlgC [Chromohalobacter sp.]
MSMFSIFDISSSAMSAQSQRMNATASNMANADSVAGPDGEPYRAKHVMFQAQSQGGSELGGVRATEVVEDDAPPRMEYRPGHPLADEDGYVAMPNVDPVDEMVDMIAASRSYQANVEVMNTSKSLMQQTLSIGQG